MIIYFLGIWTGISLTGFAYATIGLFYLAYSDRIIDKWFEISRSTLHPYDDKRSSKAVELLDKCEFSYLHSIWGHRRLMELDEEFKKI